VVFNPGQGMIEPVSIQAVLSASHASRVTWLSEGEHAREAAARLLDEAKALVFDRALEVDSLAAVVAQAAREARCAATEARACSTRAYALAWLNRFPEALASVQEAVRAAERSRDPVALATASLAAVQPLTRMGELAQALEAATRARSIFESCGDAPRAARAMVNAGVVHRTLDDPESALREFDAARPHFDGQPGILAQVESNRGEALYALSRFKEAESVLTHALRLFESVGHAQATAVVRGNLADLLNREGRLDEAAKSYELVIRAIDPARAPGDQARLRAERAEILIDIGLVDQACLELQSACAILIEHGLRPEWSRGLTALGRAQLALGRPDEAKGSLEAAVAELRALRNPAGVAKATVLLARVFAQQGESSRAVDLLRAAMVYTADRPLELAWVKLSLSQLLLELGRAKEAEPTLSEAVVTARTLGLRPLLLESLHARGRKRALLGRLDDARCDLDEALEIAHSLRGRLPGERFRVAFADRRQQLHEDAASAWLGDASPHSHARVFQVIELSRHRALADLLSSGVAVDPAEPSVVPGDTASELIDEAQHLGRELNAIYSRLSEPIQSPSDDRSRERWRASAQAAEARLSILESRITSTQRFRGLLDDAIGASETASVLGSSSAFVQYARVHGHLVACIVRSDTKVIARDLGDASLVVDAASAAQLQMGRALARGLLPPGEPESAALLREANRALEKLHDLLLRPLAANLAGCDRLIISPCAEVQHVAFEALHDGTSYLVERSRVAYAPSASVYCSLLARESVGSLARAKRHPLVVGAWDALAPAIESEVRAIAAHLPGARLLAGVHATREAFSVMAPEADLVHIACHSVAPDSGALSGRLRLTDGWLDSRTIGSLRLNAPLVVLSSCESGRGVVVGAEEMYGLVRAFLVAGARSVLATRWRLQDQLAARQLTQLWNDVSANLTRAAEQHEPGSLGRGLGVSKSLHSMVRSWISDGWHPAAWASYFLIGSPES
jgi:tetratricopeptide (TPR) repeat protein